MAESKGATGPEPWVGKPRKDVLTGIFSVVAKLRKAKALKQRAHDEFTQIVLTHNPGPKEVAESFIAAGMPMKSPAAHSRIKAARTGRREQRPGHLTELRAGLGHTSDGEPIDPAIKAAAIRRATKAGQAEIKRQVADLDRRLTAAVADYDNGARDLSNAGTLNEDYTFNPSKAELEDCCWGISRNTNVMLRHLRGIKHVAMRHGVSPQQLTRALKEAGP